MNQQLSQTDVETWDISTLMDAFEEKPAKKRKVVIPQYQRNLVWNKTQKKLLIDSIKAGLPVGAILLYKQGADTDGNNIYHLIDGLQRSTSIKTYTRNPTLFFDSNNLPTGFTIHVFQKLRGYNVIIEEQAVEKLLIQWIHKLKGFKETDGFSSSDLVYYLDDKLGDALEKLQIKELSNDVAPFLELIQEDSNILSNKVPILIYSGSQENLPIIFERLNSKGTQLTKYQVFAATWSVYPTFKISSTEIIAKIKGKYDSLIEEGLEVYNYDGNNFYTSEFNYFELFFGFGKNLIDKFPSLFGSSFTQDETESIGFNLSALCLQHDIKKMGELPKVLKDVDINKFVACVEDSTKITSDILKPFIGLRANKKNASLPSVVHSELQIASMIAKVYLLKYDDSFVEKVSWKKQFLNLKTNLPFHYLYDILRNYWSGTGDVKALELTRSDKYLSPIPRSSWDNLLNEIHAAEKEKRETKRVNIKGNLILFLKYIYTHLLSAHEELSTTLFEVEHICPVVRLKNVASEVEGIPISALSNLCLIEKDINRDKSSSTFYEYYDNLIKKGELTAEQVKAELAKIESRIFVTRKELDFLDSLSKKKIHLYFQFLDKRFETLKDQFFRLNHIK